MRCPFQGYVFDLTFHPLGHGDTTGVVAAAADLSSIVGAPAEADLDQRFNEACVLGLWAEQNGQEEVSSAWLEGLRDGVGAPYETLGEMARQTCALVLSGR